MRLDELERLEPSNQNLKQRWKPGGALLIWLNAFVLAATIVFAYLPFSNTDLFQSDMGDVSDKYYLEVTPKHWVFFIWIAIFVAQVAMVIYTLTLTCRQNELSHGKLFHDPPFLPPAFFAVYMFACVLTVTWVFAFDSEYLITSMVALISVTICLYICIFFAVKILFDKEAELSLKELWLNVVFVHNALAMFATWTTVTTMLNVGIVVRYVGGYSQNTSSLVVLITIAALLFIHFILDMFIYTLRYRYIFTPYIVIGIAYGGIIDQMLTRETYEQDSVYFILAIATLAASVLMFAIKIIVTLFRCIRSPSTLEIED